MEGSAAALALAEECSRPLPRHGGVLPTEIVSKNAAADSINQSHLMRLPGDEVHTIVRAPHCMQKELLVTLMLL